MASFPLIFLSIIVLNLQKLQTQVVLLIASVKASTHWTQFIASSWKDKHKKAPEKWSNSEMKVGRLRIFIFLLLSSSLQMFP